jgi:hypothetical protein
MADKGKARKTAEDVASTGMSLLKDFSDSRDKPLEEKMFGPSPAPKPLTPKAPTDFYTGYGAYAPRSKQGSKRSRKRGMKR